MPRTRKEKFKILSFLLQFPNAEMPGDLTEIREEIEAAFSGDDKRQILLLAKHLTETPLIRLQEKYSELFDLNASTCLNLTYHQHGDTPERGAALAWFAAIYEDFGFTPSLSELPDYLPMVLELLSQTEDGVWQQTLADHRHTISKIARRLDRQKSAYAGIFHILSGLLAQAEEPTQRGRNG